MNASQKSMRESEMVINRRLPVNIVDEDLSYFGPDLAKEISRPHIREYSDVKISAEGFLFQNNQVMSESFPSIKNFESWTKRSRFKTDLQNLSLMRNNSKDSVVWVTDAWSDRYFHWI